MTQITPAKRATNRLNIFIDGKLAFGLNTNVAARFGLRVGLELSADSIAEISQGEVRQQCFDAATNLLSRRLHSRAELGRKLQKHEYGQPIVESVLNRLEELGYLNDARFAQTRAMSEAQHKHHGRRRAMMELRKAGVKGDVLERALDSVYDSHDSISLARALAQKKAPNLKRLQPVVARRRLVGMLQRRGFDYEAIRPVIDEVLGKENS